MAELERKTLEGVGRGYEDVITGRRFPSVSTVLSVMPTPEAVKAWKKRNNGKNGNPYWRMILAYKGARGTLIHYNILNQYSDTDIGGRNEEMAEKSLKAGDWWEQYKKDNEFAQEAWEEITEQQGITQDSVLNVECYVKNTNIGYAGQFDLLYIDKDGNVCLADIKTSKYIYDKHQLQASGYAEAVTPIVDKLEIIRIHPDSGRWEVVSDDEWTDNDFQPITREERFEEFVELCEQLDVDMEKIMDEGVDDG